MIPFTGTLAFSHGTQASPEWKRRMEEHEPAEEGALCEIMTLYNHSTSRRDAKWSEFEDLAAEEERLAELGRKFAVIHRRSRVETDGHLSWVTHSVEAQSPRLRSLLDAVFSDYPSWYPDATPYAIAPPFKPYVHRWDRIMELCDQADSDELQLLRRELEQPIGSYLSALDSARKTGTVSFRNLWLILAPGSLVVSQKSGSPCVSTLARVGFVPATRACPAYWALTLVHVDWNGESCGLGSQAQNILEYEDSILVTKLDIIPLEFAPDRKGLQAKLLARGRKFEALRGFHTRAYTGKKYVSGRIIVDAHAYHQVQQTVAPKLAPLDSLTSPGSLSSQMLSAISADNGRPPSSSGSGSSGSVSSGSISSGSDSSGPETKVLVYPRLIKGFDLRAKEWCEFDVDDMEPVEWDTSPYDNLVLPEGEKDLIAAFADRRGLSTQGFDDFIAHKGKGIIILLCGPPGVGKTLTAEAVAEKSRVPLYVLSAGDLGTAPEKVEAGLAEAFECCRLWDAVLLLDEADVYLEKRDASSLRRNELVSIFLRQLEYYRGLMFLTTNRVAAIDPAFKSRLDLVLPYHDLDESCRRKVWVNFVQRLGPDVASLADGDFDQLAKTRLNGREIKNSIKTALVLANYDKPLRLGHLTTVLNIRKRVATLEEA
ncbi:ATPase family associated with various cellular activities (AAA) domain-containing protein [Hirsutella rhossiliensis]|uniref:ATPase family associated with various cellular activities (AAA) domain-containing protein n=1 Tax=Hirsutella rhossiliensis TaxID=111463 RepID=A0A9P8N2A0_9HYPO|nr:ATPase family associated with various cellular activities (AAA) domain-containing protein [Hirsutella rhossiliensis]KAH0966938.1 ATPase family associated with various cellular activities (AAA) domain-containing protein [Hirsutella rhossiliensis]